MAPPAGILALPVVVRPIVAKAAELEFTLHPPQFRIGDRLDHPPEGAADTAETAVGMLAMYPGKTIIAQRIAPMRPIVIIVNQVTISVIADKKMGHVRSPPSARARAVEPNMHVTA
jgi:hypothetical protein